MPPLETAGWSLFFAVLIVGLYANIYGLPGTVLIFIDVLVYASVTGFCTIGKALLVSLLAIALLAEGLELILYAAGASRFSVSKKGIAVSVLGSVAGALLLTRYLYGLGTLAGIFLGGFLGILLMELMHQMQLRPSMRRTKGSILGRSAGTLTKGGLALSMVVLALMSIYS